MCGKSVQYGSNSIFFPFVACLIASAGTSSGMFPFWMSSGLKSSA
jgi:hypothetical protein